MQLGNPLPVFLGIPLMACFCWLLTRWLPLLEGERVSSKTISLDGLRGILASSVLFHHAAITYTLFHAGVWQAPSSNFYAQLGPTAVLMFFFISGYLFWRKMLKDPASLKPSTLLPNRFRRIMPAYLAAVLVFFLFAGWITHFRLLVPFVTLGYQIFSFILGLFPFSNRALVAGRYSFNTLDPIVITGGIFWTLQLEWLFYFVLPFLAWFRPLRRLLWLPVLFFMLQKLIGIVPVSTTIGGSTQIVVEKFLRMFVCGFVIGMLAAYDIPSKRINAILRSPWMTPVAVAMLAYHLFFFVRGDPTFETPREPLLLAPVFFMIVAGNDFCGLLSSRPMRSLGAVSFSLYLFHGMILHFCTLILDRYEPIRLMDPLNYWLWILVISLIAVLWSTLSYWYIEHPFFARKAVP